MIEAIVGLVATVGPAGLASVFKMFSGVLIARQERMLAKEARKSEDAARFQKSLNTGTQGKASAMTRRILGIILVCTIAFIGVWSTLYSNSEYMTVATPEMKGSVKVLWGLFSIPVNAKALTVKLTLGSNLLPVLSICSMAVGFYFTPNGRK